MRLATAAQRQGVAQKGLHKPQYLNSPASLQRGVLAGFLGKLGPGLRQRHRVGPRLRQTARAGFAGIATGPGPPGTAPAQDCPPPAGSNAAASRPQLLFAGALLAARFPAAARNKSAGSATESSATDDRCWCR